MKVLTKVVDIIEDHSDALVEHRLEQLSVDGWRLLSVYCDRFNRLKAVFQREEP